MNNKLSVRAKAVIERIEYATLATVDDKGQPWNAPVYCAYDSGYNFYWGSYTDSQHSQNITGTGTVFIVIYDSTIAAGNGEGVYIQATCRELNDVDEIKFAHSLIQERRKPIPYWKLEQVQEQAPIRLYKAVPVKIWMNDEGDVDGNYIDIRSEVEV
jgi:nitroimidazol reductase NimA-like FMN-containing flavoprotein (pyridoxamine 5'-phosphate oxidase superfamily)